MQYTYRQEYVRCGKRSCRSCPHGPYWYAYWRAGGKVKKRYCGKADPRIDRTAHEPRKGYGPVDNRQDIFNRRTRSVNLALAILHLDEDAFWSDIERAYKRAVMEHHPDRGGDQVEFQLAEAAYSHLKTSTYRQR